MSRCFSFALSVFGIACLAASAACPAQPVRQHNAWSPIGLSGGGGLYTPAISAADPKRMMVNCDMSAAYITADGGMHWTMISELELHSSTRCKPAFHPTDPLTIFAEDGGAGIKVTHDGGSHWQQIGDLPGDLRGEIAIDPENPNLMMAGAGTGIFRSWDAGRTWTKCDGPTGEPLSFHFDQTTAPDRRTCYAATTDGIWRSTDSGKSWARKMAGLPAGAILDFAGGSNAKNHLVMLYCTVPSKVENGKFTGGVYSSIDRGESWQSALGTGLNVETKAFDEWAMGPIAQYQHVLTTDIRPETVYTFNSNTGIPPPHNATVYRSDDAGKHWKSTFQADPRFPADNVEPDYQVVGDGQYYQGMPSVAIDANDPERLMVVDTGIYVTTNGGKNWQCGHTRRAPDGISWLCNGLVITTTWNYYIDPFDSNRHYIAYTDLGFARSTNGGGTWMWWPQQGRSPWNNTCYQLAFDPQTPGLVWGAFSNTHDIPNANIIYGGHRSTYPGGVCVSTDHCATWTKSNSGLPAMAVTSIVLDARSPKGGRTLYAGLFGAGVYKSTDNGQNWTAHNAGLGSEDNKRICQLSVQPDGTLYALVTAFRQNNKFVAEGVGLYRSTDGADHWSLVNASQPLFWPKGFTVDPKDGKSIYLSACNANGQEQAGLYHSADGGITWKLLARKGPEHFGAFLSPTQPGWIYMTLTEGAPKSGLWLSKDHGATWVPITAFPFANTQRITFDPANPNQIYVTTFGGSVWTGPAD